MSTGTASQQVVGWVGVFLEAPVTGDRGELMERSNSVFWGGAGEVKNRTDPKDQERCFLASGRRRAKLRWFGQAAWAAARSAVDQSRAVSGMACVELAGAGAVAVVFVVGQEAGEVVQGGFGAGCAGASAVAVGAEGGVMGEDGVTKLVDVGGLEGFLVAAGGVGVFADLVDILHGHAGCADAFVAPDGVEEALEG